MEGDRDLGEAGPEAAPPAGKNGHARGGGVGDEAFEDQEKQVVREGADEVDPSSAWI
jgi:hypothetical protein